MIVLYSMLQYTIDRARASTAAEASAVPRTTAMSCERVLVSLRYWLLCNSVVYCFAYKPPSICFMIYL